MADLDDFFAKKDKKKTKGKPKFLTAEELVKNLEDTSKRDIPAKPIKKAEPVIETASSGTSGASGDETKPKAVVEQPPTEEEWKEFEEEQRKDYTGLKIGHLTINDEDDSTQTDGDEDDGDSDSNLNNESSNQSGNGPWKKVVPAEDVTQIPMEIEKPKVYISPALRHSQGATIGARVKPRNRAAPDITNADYFPSLGAARPEEQRKKKNEPAFEEVRHGGRLQRVQEQTVTRTAATNRFQSLDEDDS